MDKNCHILCQLLMKYCKDPSLSSKLDKVWARAYDEERFHLLDGIIYHKTKHTCVMTLKYRTLINTILHDCHDSVVSGNLSEDRTLERVKTCSWWQNWRKDVAEYFQTCDRSKKSNRSTGKNLGIIIQIQEPKYLWEIAHMDWVTTLPPGGNRSFNACLVLVDRYRKTPKFLPCHKDGTDMETVIMIWNRVISHAGLFQNLISDRDPKFTSALLTNLHNLFGTKLSFSAAYHPQTDGLPERMIQNLEDIIRRFCAYGLEFKDSYCFTHYWCTLIQALELAYKTSIHSSTVKTPVMLEKGCNPIIPYDTLKKDLVDLNPTAKSFKKRWEKSHKPPDLKVGDLVLVSTLSYNNIEGPKKLKYSFAGPFMMRELHGPNSVQLELTGELMNKHPTFPVILIKPYSSSDKELSPLRNKPPIETPPLEEG
ncbi:hypothetical protein O181_079818 [Austropuccinia psidii MF-1]|uniref:Integrase catalytic domain-containing protein n=1 Tax=Austropuccinia psidii MF-1 TaxID=1389203 RepID=A0A9Q3FLR9_9BASI|nr:hypothetical protein [Austropuccinia psidii MF-1]